LSAIIDRNLILLFLAFLDSSKWESEAYLRNVPSGDYNMHLWIEGVPQSFLEGSGRLVHLPQRAVDLGTIYRQI